MSQTNEGEVRGHIDPHLIRHVRLSPGSIQLDWETEADENISSYTVEKYVESAKVWQDLAEIIPAENESSHSYTDIAADEGTNTYRLKETLEGGETRYTPSLIVD